MLINKKNLGFHMVFALSFVLIASFVGNNFRQSFSKIDDNDDYDMVRKYLLNESTLYGDNRPKIWIHSTHDINARKWKNFMSRNSTDINQPYLYLTVQSIINHCGDDFHICLIDDNSFDKLLPEVAYNISSMEKTMKEKYRNINLCKLLQKYGGIVVPDSLLCLKSLTPLYKQCEKERKPFMVEQIIRTPNTEHLKPYLPSLYCIGCPKKCPMMQTIIDKISHFDNDHFHQENVFQSEFEKWANDQCKSDRITCVDGGVFGIKDKIGKPILIDDLMSEHFIDVDPTKLLGIYIPKYEILKRPKYEYFSILPADQILNSNHILGKYFKMSMVDSVKPQRHEQKKDHIVSI